MEHENGTLINARRLTRRSEVYDETCADLSTHSICKIC